MKNWICYLLTVGVLVINMEWVLEATAQGSCVLARQEVFSAAPTLPEDKKPPRRKHRILVVSCVAGVTPISAGGRYALRGFGDLVFYIGGPS